MNKIILLLSIIPCMLLNKNLFAQRSKQQVTINLVCSGSINDCNVETTLNKIEAGIYGYQEIFSPVQVKGYLTQDFFNFKEFISHISGYDSTKKMHQNLQEICKTTLKNYYAVRMLKIEDELEQKDILNNISVEHVAVLSYDPRTKKTYSINGIYFEQQKPSRLLEMESPKPVSPPPAPIKEEPVLPPPPPIREEPPHPSHPIVEEVKSDMPDALKSLCGKLRHSEYKNYSLAKFIYEFINGNVKNLDSDLQHLLQTISTQPTTFKEITALQYGDEGELQCPVVGEIQDRSVTLRCSGKIKEILNGSEKETTINSSDKKYKNNMMLSFFEKPKVQFFRNEKGVESINENDINHEHLIELCREQLIYLLEIDRKKSFPEAERKAKTAEFFEIKYSIGD